MNVQDVMTRDVVTVTPTTSLKRVATLLLERRVSGVPVVDESGRPVGVVSEADLLVKERGEHRPRSLLGRLVRDADREKLEARTAGEAMTSPPVTVSAGVSLSEAAGLMIERDVNRLPVLDGDELVGIVTRADLIRAFTRDDAEIEREIREKVLLQTFSIPPETISVTVREGEVTIAGEVENDSVRELLLAFLARVPGVVDVESRLRVREDSQVPKPQRARP